MSAGTGCCGSDIKTWAKIIAIVGIVLSTLSLIFSIFVWLYAPSSVSLLVAFILALIGINRDRSGYLTAAKVILGINIVVDIFIAICSIYLAIAVPQKVIDDVNRSTNLGESKDDFRILYAVYSVLILIVIGLLIFAFVIFQKARLQVVQNPRRCSVFPVTFSGQQPQHTGAAPVYISSPPYPTAAPPYSVSGYSSGYGSNLPMYPQAYNGTPQLPPRGYNIDTTPFQPAYPQGYPTNAQTPMPIYNMNPIPTMYSQNNDSSPTVYQNETQSKTELH
uniref:Uncharacterized protein n=1 Tax=Panagrolaimus davidi TaxID=227884 RepID=A0A914PHC8_9BILA